MGAAQAFAIYRDAFAPDPLAQSRSPLPEASLEGLWIQVAEQPPERVMRGDPPGQRQKRA
jgi:hypothetical protein